MELGLIRCCMVRLNFLYQAAERGCAIIWRCTIGSNVSSHGLMN